MDGITSALDSRASFEVTAFVAIWIGVTALALMVMSVLVRVRRLELAQATESPATPVRPYGQIRGRSIAHLLPKGSATQTPGTLILLSSSCRSCAGLLDELGALRDDPPIGLLWLDREPETLPPLPASVVAIPNGGAIARELGIQVTPFVVELDGEGVVVDGRPASRLSSIEIVSSGKVTARVA